MKGFTETLLSFQGPHTSGNLESRNRKGKGLYKQTGSRVHARDDYYNGNDRSRIKTLRDDGLITSGRTATAGFTLIELLVVVLIIGILAAAAVPQYEKVVEKTRAMEAVGLVRSVRQAQELYYMQNSRYASSLDSLTLSFPKSLAKNFNWDGPEQLQYGRFAISRSAEKYFYVIVASGDFRGVHLPGKIYCAAQPNNQKAVEICSEIGSSEEDSDGSWRRFVIQ